MQMAYLALLGDFDFYELEQAQSVLAAPLFLIYMITSNLVLVNVFIAIISEAFEIAKEDIANGKDDFIGSSLALQFNEVATCHNPLNPILS